MVQRTSRCGAILKAALSVSKLLLVFVRGVCLSRESVEWVMGKIVLDARFRERLLAEPEQALAAFDLTRREKAGLGSLDSETMEAVAKTLAVRLSKTNPATRGFFSLYTDYQ